MIANVFLDNNILVYAAIGTGKEEPNRQRALSLIESEKFATSAHILYSEDHNDGQQYGGVMVVNPFKGRVE